MLVRRTWAEWTRWARFTTIASISIRRLVRHLLQRAHLRLLRLSPSCVPDEEGTNSATLTRTFRTSARSAAQSLPGFSETCREPPTEHEATDPTIVVAEFEAFEQQCLTTDGLALVEYALQLVARGCALDLNGVPGGGHHRLRRLQQFLRQRLSSSAEDCAWDEIDDYAQDVTSICCEGATCPEGSLVPTSCSPGCAVTLHHSLCRVGQRFSLSTKTTTKLWLSKNRAW